MCVFLSNLLCTTAILAAQAIQDTPWRLSTGTTRTCSSSRIYKDHFLLLLLPPDFWSSMLSFDMLQTDGCSRHPCGARRFEYSMVSACQRRSFNKARLRFLYEWIPYRHVI